ncbi:hypothetical protein [Labilithrix luteola]|nr:hypothetical protein [Labilithrix luteola]
MPSSLRNLRCQLGVLAVALVFATCACHSRKGDDAAPVDAKAEAIQLTAFLPSRIGAFTADGEAWTNSAPDGPTIEAHRFYSSADGRKATIELVTGDISKELATLDSEETHAFGSDTPTYWRTTTIAGHRARVVEEKPTPKKSQCLVRVGPNHVANVTIAPTPKPGGCVTIASLLDFGGIVASGGVPASPKRPR